MLNREGDIAVCFIKYYMEKLFDKNQKSRCIPLFLNSIKINVFVEKDSSIFTILVIKHNVGTTIISSEPNVVVFNKDNNSMIHLKESKQYILDIIFLLTQTFGMVIQPLSLRKDDITFLSFQKEFNNNITHHFVLDVVPISIWKLLLSNMTIEYKTERLADIHNF